MGTYAQELDGTGKIIRDEKGNPLTEEVLRDGIIFRFTNGLLHGGEGSPAVEAPGHIEYWDNGKLTMVCTEGFSIREYYENGVMTKKESAT